MKVTQIESTNITFNDFLFTGYQGVIIQLCKILIWI